MTEHTGGVGGELAGDFVQEALSSLAHAARVLTPTTGSGVMRVTKVVL
jgi:type IV secretory pathway TrbL component